MNAARETVNGAQQKTKKRIYGCVQLFRRKIRRRTVLTVLLDTVSAAAGVTGIAARELPGGGKIFLKAGKGYINWPRLRESGIRNQYLRVTSLHPAGGPAGKVDGS